MNKQTYLMTYEEINELVGGINLFLQQELPVMVSLDLARAKRVVKSHAEDYQITLDSVRKKFVKLNKDGSAKTDDNNQAIFKSDKARESFTEELNKLKNKEIEVELIDPPTKEQILDIYKEGEKAKGAAISRLLPLLEPRTKKSK